MRLGWILVISPGKPLARQHFILFLGTIEILRRFMWTIFRVEWKYAQKGSPGKELL
jgi:hypothetical protein